jgi:hypothetical protein
MHSTSTGTYGTGNPFCFNQRAKNRLFIEKIYKTARVLTIRMTFFARFCTSSKKVALGAVCPEISQFCENLPFCG